MQDKSRAGQKPGAIGQDEAESTAIDIFVWLSGQPDLMSRFLALTGVDAGSIRQAAREPGFLAAVTGFLMAHEPTLLAFCAASEVSAERVAASHNCLAGPAGETSV